MMREAFHLIVFLSFIATSIVTAQGGDHSSVSIERKSCQAPDGVTIVYSASGSGKTALVFIHGGLADRTFFDGQLRAFARRYRVVALDLADLFLSLGEYHLAPLLASSPSRSGRSTATSFPRTLIPPGKSRQTSTS